MGKKLSEMSSEELWQLFPIYLTEHQDCWEEWYEEEADMLRCVLPEEQVKRISHIGSTSVNTIWAKPTVDILVEISGGCDMRSVKEILLKAGYVCMSEDRKRISFNKGYTETGFADKVFHLHLRYEGDHDELYFRDYLIEHPSAAKEYEKLKLELWRKYEYNRDQYTECKSDFVVMQTKRAKDEFGNRYGK